MRPLKVHLWIDGHVLCDHSLPGPSTLFPQQVTCLLCIVKWTKRTGEEEHSSRL